MAGKDKVTSPEEIERLRAEVTRLSKALTDQAQENEEARLRAKFIANDVEEVATGREVEVPKCSGYKTVGYRDDGRPILEAVWETERVPTFMYKIDMPPIGGMDIKINGNSLQHGQIYEFNLHELRLIKDIVFRLRQHEASIHGSNENAYRRPANAQFSGKVGGRVH